MRSLLLYCISLKQTILITGYVLQYIHGESILKFNNYRKVGITFLLSVVRHVQVYLDLPKTKPLIFRLPNWFNLVENSVKLKMKLFQSKEKC